MEKTSAREDIDLLPPLCNHSHRKETFAILCSIRSHSGSDATAFSAINASGKYIIPLIFFVIYKDTVAKSNTTELYLNE